MREIKFKAYAKAYNKIVNVDRLGLNSDGTAQEIIVAERELGEYDSDEWADLQAGEFELLQYAGLKDKNGKEIYEGDIVSFKSAHSNYDYKTIGEVVWYCGEAAFLVECNGEIFKHFDEIREIEVLGNVYENPELLQ